MIVRKTHPQEWKRVAELFAIAFSLPISTAPARESETDLQHWAAYDEDGEMMSALTLTDYSVRFDGQSCRMSGVGGVSTLPQYRGKGGIRGCFEACLPALFEEGYDFSYLYPFSTAFYRKFGYENCVSRLDVTLDLSRLRLPRASGCFRLCEGREEEVRAIQAVDRAWEERYNMTVLHREDYYNWVQKLDPASTLESTYVWYDEGGEPGGYVTFRTAEEKDGRNLLCSRFFFLDKKSFQGLMSLFAAHSYDHRFAKFSLPAGQGCEYLLSEWASGAVTWCLSPAGMVRAVNVPQVLMKAAYHGSGVLTMEIQDPQICANNDRFRLTFKNGRAVSVEATEEEPEIRLTAAAFSALICGSGSLEFMEGVEILRDSPAIRQVFRKKPMMITDFF